VTLNPPFWLSQRDITELFDKDVRTVNEHIKNTFSEGECDPGQLSGISG